EWSGAVTIIDIGSTNGITVNGRQLTQSIEIYPQDVIRLGSVRLAIRHLPDTDLDNRNAIQLRQKPSNTLRTEPGTVLKEKMPDDSDGKETVSDKDYPDMTRRNIRVAHLLLVGGCFLFLAGLLALYLLNSGK
ncbi:FHA domain-containing protein, partial [bacterium]|nr:FHA domain-containing protein [candidate division CSSED10-310 bacterium]